MITHQYHPSLKAGQNCYFPVLQFITGGGRGGGTMFRRPLYFWIPLKSGGPILCSFPRAVSCLQPAAGKSFLRAPVSTIPIIVLRALKGVSLGPQGTALEE